MQGIPVKRQFKILIADRNPHVREFLKREMMMDGYQVRLAENGRQLIKWAFKSERLDLLIVDPDFPDVDVAALFAKLQDRIPPLPMVVHAFLSDYTEYPEVLNYVPFVEKEGRSIEFLRKVVYKILHNSYLKHAQTAGNNGRHPVEKG
jgi:DNA-binding NtrC family response regulator